MKNIQFNLLAKMEIGALYYTKISVESVCLHVADQFFFFLDFVAWHSQFVYFFYYDHKINGNGSCVFRCYGPQIIPQFWLV